MMPHCGIESRLPSGLLFLLLGLATSAAIAGEMRTWKAAEGAFKVEAALTEQSETHVKLKKKDGTELTVPREKLSKEDLDYLLFADPPLPAHAAKGKQASPPKPASTDNAASKDTPASTEKSAATPKSAVEPKPIVTPPSAVPAASAGRKEKTKQTTPDTFESIRRSFNETFDAVASHEKQEVLPVSPGTDFVALVKDLRKPITLPTFEVQSKADVRLATAGVKSWQHSTCLAAGGNHLLEYDHANKQLLVWNVETGKQICDWKCGELANPRCFAISPTGKYLAVGRDDSYFEVYDTIAKKSVRRLKVDEKHKGVFRVAFNWQEESVFVLTGSAYQMLISLVGGPDLGISLLSYLPWHMHSEEKPFSFDVKQDQIELTVSAEGRFGVHVSDKLHLSCEASDYPRPTTFFSSAVYQHVFPVRYGIIAWNARVATHKQIQLYSTKRDKPPSDMPIERSAPIGGIAQCSSVDREERYLWGCHIKDQVRLVEIVDVNYLKRSLKVILPPPQGGFTPQDCLWLSAEKQRIVSWSPVSKQMTVYDLRNFMEPPSWRLYSLVLRAFLEKRYDFLDGFFAELGKLDQPLQGSDDLLPLREALWIFLDSPTLVHANNWQGRISAWTKERADSIGPRLLLAAQIIDDGWKARGQGVAATVTPEGWEAFAKAGTHAEKILEPIMAQAQPPAYAFVVQHSITKMLKRNAEEQVELAKRLCKYYPGCPEFHAGMVQNLLPRWYGKQGDSVAYAEKIAELLGGDAGEIAYAEMGYSLLDLHQPEIYLTATEFDPIRVTRGLIKATQQTPEDARPYYRLLQLVYYLRFTNPDSDVLDPELDEQTMKAYHQALAQFESLAKRYDWTTYVPPKFTEMEFAIYYRKLGTPPKPKAKIRNAN